MDGNLAEALAWSIAAIALFSFLGVSSWASARRLEREAYYRSEAIKKLAEMQGTASEPVLALLREALKPPQVAPKFASTQETREFYRSETMKRIAEMKGTDASAVLAAMREDEKQTARRRREGLKLAGLILAGAGVGLLIFLEAIVPDKPVYLVGTIPLLVGAAFLAYVFVLAPNEGDR